MRLARTPKQAAEFGRDRKRPLRLDWELVKDHPMRRAVLAKFEQHPDVRAILLATCDEPIVESAPGDRYWGCGADGSGKNMVGIILEEVRATLRTRAEPSG